MDCVSPPTESNVYHEVYSSLSPRSDMEDGDIDLLMRTDPDGVHDMVCIFNAAYPKL